MSSELELKRELLELIADTDKGIKDKIDYSRLLDLSTAIAKHDQENVRFSVDAKLVERLGEQLVAKKTTALSELIKNAYDADSTSVVVEFVKTESVGGKIIVTDTGNGMDFDALVEGFMTISTSDKISNPVSPIYNRTRAGKKGIGRFSAQKIGQKLKLITKREIDNYYLIVDIDWKMFNAKTPLNSISNKINKIKDGYSFNKGTILEISDVREAWTENNIKTTFNYISGIVQSQDSSDEKTKDPGFHVNFMYVDLNSDKKTLSEINEKTEFLEKADLKAVAQMRPSGVLEIDITGFSDERFTEKLEFTEGYDSKLLDCNYKVEVLYFSRERGSSNTKPLKDYLNTNGGIRLFRNGFNVAPYGSRYNDWLGLDDSYQKRVILPPHSNTNYVGYVSVKDPNGLILEETSSREGVIENDIFSILIKATYDVAIKIASHVATVREKKVTASQTGYVSNKKSKEDELKATISELKQKLEQSLFLVSKSEVEKTSEEIKLETNEISNDIENKSLANEVLESLNVVTEKLTEYIDEQIMYRVLSSTGLAISEFTHEIQTCLTNLELSSQTLASISNIDPRISRIADQLEENLGMLSAYTDFFDGTMRSNSNREKNFYDIRKLVKRFISAMEPTTKRRGYEFITHFDSWDIWTRKIHISEIMSIFINLFTNACKAIERAGQKNGKLLIDVSTSANFMTIKFEDNGDGIPKDKWSRVFEPLYTTAMPAKPYSSDNEYNRGMGLGLSITEQIISEMNGEIAVAEPSEGYSTCLKIILPRTDESELPEDAY